MPPYRVNGALLRLDGPEVQNPVTIDLLEWKEPRDEAAPYPHLYHYGLARIALATTDLNGDMARLKAAGATFLSEPAAMPRHGGHGWFAGARMPGGDRPDCHDPFCTSESVYFECTTRASELFRVHGSR